MGLRGLSRSPGNEYYILILTGLYDTDQFSSLRRGARSLKTLRCRSLTDRPLSASRRVMPDPDPASIGVRGEDHRGPPCSVPDIPSGPMRASIQNSLPGQKQGITGPTPAWSRHQRRRETLYHQQKTAVRQIRQTGRQTGQPTRAGRHAFRCMISQNTASSDARRRTDRRPRAVAPHAGRPAGKIAGVCLAFNVVAGRRTVEFRNQ